MRVKVSITTEDGELLERFVVTGRPMRTPPSAESQAVEVARDVREIIEHRFEVVEDFE